MELYLVYIKFIGDNYEDKNLYQFIFSDTITDVDGYNWDAVPAAGRPEPPFDKFIKKVGILESDLILDVIQDDYSFAVWDAVDGVIALAWENIKAYDSYPNKRLSFRFGEPIEVTESKLYERDLILKYGK